MFGREITVSKQIGEKTTAVFWHSTKQLTLFTPKEKITLSTEETAELLNLLQTEYPKDMEEASRPFDERLVT